MARHSGDGDAFRRLENLGDDRRRRVRAEEGDAMRRLAEMGQPPSRFGRRKGGAGGNSSLASKLMKAVGVMVVVALVGVGCTVGYAVWRNGQLGRIDLGGVLDGSGGKAMTVLLVGSDTRSDLEGGQTRQFGSGKAVAGQRSDTIMLLRVDPATNRAAILSLPRDLYVTIAGTGQKARINSAFEDGPETLIKTIQQSFNIPIDHYAEVNFDTFRGVVNTIGGVKVPFDTPVRDYDPGTGRNYSGLNIREAGCITLDGDQALSYVRSRHYQIYKNGRWQSDPKSDLGRIERQQDFMRRVAGDAVSEAKTNPLKFNALVDSAVKNVTVDEGLGIRDMVKLANRFKSLDPGSIQMMTMPNRPENVGGAAVLIPDKDEAARVVKEFIEGPPPAPETPSEGSAGTTAAPATTAAPSQFVPKEDAEACR